MFEFLVPHDGPVIEGLESHELVMAKDQPEYIPLRCVASSDNYGRRLSRWTLSAEQRRAIAAGGDIYLELLTFNRPMNPIRVGVGDPNPTYFRNCYSLPADPDAHLGARKAAE